MSTKSITRKELDNQTKQMRILLELKGENYNEWLYHTQQNELNKNFEVIMNSLKQEREEKEELEKQLENQLKDNSENEEEIEGKVNEKDEEIESINPMRQRLQSNTEQ